MVKKSNKAIALGLTSLALASGLSVMVNTSNANTSKMVNMESVKTINSKGVDQVKIKYTGITTANSLNVRSGASTKYDVIGGLKKGSKVDIISKLDNNWLKIKYKSGYGYVSGKYVNNIIPVSSSNQISEVLKTGIVNCTTLNVRNGSSTSHSVIGKLSKGTKVDILKIESNGWYKINYKNGAGYVHGDYVDIAGSSSNNQSDKKNNLNKFLFVGDSFTFLLKSTIEANNSKVYVHAKSGSMPSYWLDKVSSMPNKSDVNGVVLLIGVNGAGYESNKTDTKALIDKLATKYPNKTIYVQKIFPVGKNFTSANPASFNKKIASLNSVIEAHCKTKKNVKFINTQSGFVVDGYLQHTKDGLHISDSYQNKFYDNIVSAVKNTK